MSLVEQIWESDTLPARAARLLLTPAERLFAAIVSRRNAAFDGRPLRPSPLPALSVGNLTVGGTGKTPVAAWCTRELRARGAKPSIVLRGYGDDEWRVHALLNPDLPVLVTPDRTGGMTAARSRGADCAVLDDAFQHRHAARVADVVLLSADRWRTPVRLLPAGPFREPLRALRRADVAVVTVKAAGAAAVAEVEAAIEREAPGVARAVIRLVPGKIRLAATIDSAALVAHGRSAGTGARAGRRAPDDPMLSHAPTWLAGRPVVATSAIGDPEAFVAQLRALGADVRHEVRFPDHHDYGPGDVSRIVRLAEGTDGAVCTLKDAVKLQRLWPREAPPLWYVSQSVVVDRGAEALDRVFTRVLAARAAMALTAG